MKKCPLVSLLLAFLAVLAIAGVLFVFPWTPAHADQCPGSDTCPTSQIAIAQGPNAIEVKWIEPDNLPIDYLLTTNPPAPGQPVPELVISPQDWQDHVIVNLHPSTTYTVKICGYYSSSNQSCVTTNAVTTLPQSAGGDTPTPTITNVSVTTNSITIFWNGNLSYSYYNVMGGLTPQTQTGGGPSGSFTFSGLAPGSRYRVQVEGCLMTYTSHCSQWASLDVTTALLPPVPAIAPQNLHTSNRVSDIWVLWTNTPNYLSVTASRAPSWPGGVPQTPNTVDDVYAVAGQLYAYKICLNYKSGTACGTTTGALPPKCTITFSCPNKVYSPPNYVVQTEGPPVDFYQRSPDGTMSFLLTGTQVSGTSLDYNVFIVACASGTQAQASCSSYSIYKGPSDWCAPPPPPPPPPPPDHNCCIACVKAGGNCNRGPHGCTCF